MEFVYKWLKVKLILPSCVCVCTWLVMVDGVVVVGRRPH